MESTIKIQLKTHTIILLVGPDGAGKTRFAHYLENKLEIMTDEERKPFKVRNISFDEIMMPLVGVKHITALSKTSRDFKMCEEQAENILFSQLKASTSYPVTSDFVIIDHTSLTPEFREKVVKISEEQHYHIQVITFNFKDPATYFKCQPHQPKAMRRALSNEMPSSVFKSITNIDSLYYKDIEVTVEDFYDFECHMLPKPSDSYFIIGDIHGCFDEFVSLLENQGFVIGEDLKVSHPEGKEVLLVGDLIDKGRDIPKVVEFAHANIGIFKMVMGNHESFVYRVLKGLMPGTSITDIMKKQYFQSIDIFLADEVLKAKFFEVVESMKMFYTHEEFIVTHSPCQTKYLGKLSTEASRAMRDFKYPKVRDHASFGEFMYAFDESLEFMKKEARDSHPLHVFGHVVTETISRFKNKVAIDTGCASGGELTGIYVLPHGRIRINSVPSLTKKSETQKSYTFF